MDPVRLVIVGHVDHGKSTLIGRLLHDTGSLPEGRYEQVVEMARRRGTPVELANVMDAFQAERDQNVTIDTAHIWFNARGRQYVIIDAPGHIEFLKNMVTGAASADAGIVVVDAQDGVREQSRRHGYLLSLLGVRQVIVAINKMDLAGYSRDVFERVAAEYRAFLESIGIEPLEVVPMSAAHGDNVATGGAHLQWFAGPSILDALGRLAPRKSAAEAALRFPVQDVYRFDRRRIVAGRIESGQLRAGDVLTFLPGRKQGTVHSIERWASTAGTRAVAGDAIGLTLVEQLFIERGVVACATTDLPAVVSEFEARVFWLGRASLSAGRRYRLKLTTQELDCEIAAIHRVIDGASLADVHREVPAIERHEVAEVRIRTTSPVVVDPFDQVPALGRFVLVDDRDVAGGGIVLRAGPPAVHVEGRPASLPVQTARQVSQEERHRRHGHRGGVVWLTGLPGSGKSTLAGALERQLFDRGMQVFVLDGENLRFGLSADLGFSPRDRSENIRRVAEVAKLFAEAGVIAIASFISPYRSDRARARQIMIEGGTEIPFIEAFVDAPVEVCEQRDRKGLYARARAGLIREFTGISAPYERPEQAEVVLRTSDRTIDECVAALLEHVLRSVRQTP